VRREAAYRVTICMIGGGHSLVEGRVVFASGSPFAPVHREGVTVFPAQANNAYVFPSVGYAAVLTQSTAITDEVDTPKTTHSLASRGLRVSLSLS
jgi:malic enzyme